MSTSHPGPATSRIEAIAFNALSAALGEVDRFVPLTDRQKVAGAVLGAVREEFIAQLAAERQKVGDNEGATLQADYVIGGVCRGLSDAIEIVQGKR